MKIFCVDFGTNEKTVKIIEEKLNAVLEQGQFKSVKQMESPTTGRLFFSIFVNEDAAPDTFVKVFRELNPREMAEKINGFLADANVKAIEQTVSCKSNAMITTFFCKKKA